LYDGQLQLNPKKKNPIESESNELRETIMQEETEKER